MTEKATISKLVVYISLQFFNVRPFIKTDKPQDENEGNKKIQLSTTRKKKLKRKQHNFKKNLEMSVVRDTWQICIPLPKMMSTHNAK